MRYRTSRCLTSFFIAAGLLGLLRQPNAQYTNGLRSTQKSIPSAIVSYINYLTPAGDLICNDAGSCYENGIPVSSPEIQTPQTIQLYNVPVISQSLGTSCGEAAFAMAYNYAYPDNPISEWDVIQVAVTHGWYKLNDPARVFTSPVHLQDIGNFFAGINVTAGNVSRFDPVSAEQLLIEQLLQGHPVIVDVNAIMGDTGSSSHFVVVTGIDLQKELVYYNDPYGYNPSGARQAGRRISAWNIFWNSWAGNSDPNGAGWYMTLK